MFGFVALTYIRRQVRCPSWRSAVYPGKHGGTHGPCLLAPVRLLTNLHNDQALNQGATPSMLADLRERVQEITHYKHHSIRTEFAYVERDERFVQLHGKHHLRETGEPELRSFFYGPIVNGSMAYRPPIGT